MLQEIQTLSEKMYKGHHLTEVEDAFHQVGIIIDGVAESDYASYADAKRVIDGKAPIWVNDGYMWDEANKKVVKEHQY